MRPPELPPTWRIALRRASLVLAAGLASACASRPLGRPVEIRAYTREKLERQLQSGNAVVRRILNGPKRWVVGDEQRLGTVAA